MVQAGVRNGSYAEASRELHESAELEIGPKAIERAVKRIGGERLAERAAGVEGWQALPLPEQQRGCPLPLAPQVAVVEFDCGKMLIRERARKRPSRATAEVPVVDEEVCSEAVAAEVAMSLAVEQASADAVAAADHEAPLGEASDEATADVSSQTDARDEEECRSRFWRDHKVGCLLTMHSREHAEDPCPQIPETFLNPRRMTQLVRELGHFGATGPPETDLTLAEPAESIDRPGRPQPRVKTILASRVCSAVFGGLLAAAAWSRGFAAARCKGFVADGAAMNWTLHARFFSHYVPILDFIHALQYVFAAALTGRTFAEGWPVYCRWIQAVWSGDVPQVLTELQQRQAEIGLPPHDAAAADPRQIVATTLGYLDRHQTRMDYAHCRRLGLPLMSSYVESAVKQINRRVKGTEKFWSERGGEAMLQLRGDYLSDTAPLDRFWQQRLQTATGQRRYRRAT
jgi:hypothetical protein